MKLIDLQKQIAKLIEEGYGEYVAVHTYDGYLTPISQLEPETKRRSAGMLPPREVVFIK